MGSRSDSSSPQLARPGDGESTHLYFLDGLRGFAALYVVLHHFLPWSAEGVSQPLRLAIAWADFGHFAVVMFIVISGFSLMLPVALNSEHRIRGGLPNYFKRRAKRILPAYFAALIFSVLVIIGTHLWRQGGGIASLKNIPDLSVGSLVSHFLLIHNWDAEWNSSINMALWSIGTEWQIYFLFPFILLPAWRYGKSACVLVGLVIGLLPLIFLPENANLSWACPWFVSLFAMGMMIASNYGRNLPIAANSRFWLGSAITFLIGCVVAKLFLRGEGFAWIRDLSAGAFSASFIAFCAASVRQKRPLSRLFVRIFESRPAIALGAISYSLYLTHCAVLTFFNSLTSFLELTPDQALFLRAGVGVPLAILLAYGFYRLFELPFLHRKKPIPLPSDGSPPPPPAERIETARRT